MCYSEGLSGRVIAKVGRRKKKDGVVDGGLAKVARRKRSAGSSSWLSQVGGWL